MMVDCGARAGFSLLSGARAPLSLDMTADQKVLFPDASAPWLTGAGAPFS
jgi:hypothetical protein